MLRLNAPPCWTSTTESTQWQRVWLDVLYLAPSEDQPQPTPAVAAHTTRSFASAAAFWKLGRGRVAQCWPA